MVHGDEKQPKDTNNTWDETVIETRNAQRESEHLHIWLRFGRAPLRCVFLLRPPDP